MQALSCSGHQCDLTDISREGDPTAPREQPGNLGLCGAKQHGLTPPLCSCPESPWIKHLVVYNTVPREIINSPLPFKRNRKSRVSTWQWNHCLEKNSYKETFHSAGSILGELSEADGLLFWVVSSSLPSRWSYCPFPYQGPQHQGAFMSLFTPCLSTEQTG